MRTRDFYVILVPMSDRRDAAFAEIRRRNNVADASRTPTERLKDAEFLLEVALAAPRRSQRSLTDEPNDVWRRIREKDT